MKNVENEYRFVPERKSHTKLIIILVCILIVGGVILYYFLMINKNNIAKPVLDEGMIPIVFDTNGGTIVKTVSEDDPSWYNYEEKKWANVVLVKDEVRRRLKNSNPGTLIDSEDILAYYVWIPRYKYKIWEDKKSSTGNENLIKIVFETKDSKKSLGTKKGRFRTHPAFTFGDVELNGIWVGKFEMTGTEKKPTILPDEISVRKKSIMEFFEMNKKIEKYGLIDNSDVHMIKNSEWGAVAYLSNSIYGAGREIYINNSSDYYTGRSGGNVGGLTPAYSAYLNELDNMGYNKYGYYTWDGYLLDYNTNNRTNTKDLTKVASTTGNIYGIYDMVGGALEYVMGNYNGNVGKSKFTTMPDLKYYDKYELNAITNACNSQICYGHALSETVNWYNDNGGFFDEDGNWLRRGGHYSYGKAAGIFYYNKYDGESNEYISTRSVIAVDNF